MTYPFFLKQWREFRELTQEQLAAAVGTSQGYVNEMERGDRRYNRDWLEKFAGALGCSPGDLLSTNPKEGPHGIPLVGKVFAGPDGNYFDDYDDWAHPILPPLQTEGRIAAINEGESMLPRFRPGETLIFGPERTDPTPLVNREVMAAVDDGRRLVKVLRPSRTKGLWDLYSINTAFQVIEGQRLLWVREFEGLLA